MKRGHAVGDPGVQKIAVPRSIVEKEALRSATPVTRLHSPAAAPGPRPAPLLWPRAALPRRTEAVVLWTCRSFELRLCIISISSLWHCIFEKWYITMKLWTLRTSAAPEHNETRNPKAIQKTIRGPVRLDHNQPYSQERAGRISNHRSREMPRYYLEVVAGASQAKAAV